MVLIPLGTAAGKPMYGRHLPAMALVLEGRIVLFDCGEATQFQMRKARLRTSRVDVICITHLHGDHFYGLPGLITTMALDNRQKPLTIIAPDDLSGILDMLPGTRPHERSFEIRFKGMNNDCDQAHFDLEGFTVTARPLEHRTLTFGYRLEAFLRPGRLDGHRARALGVQETEDFMSLAQGKAITIANGRTIRPEEVQTISQPPVVLAYVTDTRPCTGGLELARGATLLVHEATYLHELLPKAISTRHTTALEGAELAKEAGAQALLVFHSSSRYADTEVLAVEARSVFPRSDVAQELKRYRVEHQSAPEFISTIP